MKLKLTNEQKIILRKARPVIFEVMASVGDGKIGAEFTDSFGEVAFTGNEVQNTYDLLTLLGVVSEWDVEE